MAIIVEAKKPLSGKIEIDVPEISTAILYIDGLLQPEKLEELISNEGIDAKARLVLAIIKAEILALVVR